MPLATKPKPAAKAGAVKNMDSLLGVLCFCRSGIQEKHF